MPTALAQIHFICELANIILSNFTAPAALLKIKEEKTTQILEICLMPGNEANFNIFITSTYKPNMKCTMQLIRISNHGVF